MLKSSHYYTLVLHYQVSPTPKDKGDPWEGGRVGSLACGSQTVWPSSVAS